MIVSASYRTDIPAFYGDWFRKRYETGRVSVRNPYNNALYDVSLRKEDVSGFVFWKKNAKRFLNALEIVSKDAIPFVVQHSITGYPTVLERSAPGAEDAIATIREISRRYGSRVPVWRYDPVVFTEVTPNDRHIANFSSLASQMDGYIDEVVVSVAQIYRKTRRNLDKASKVGGFAWFDPPVEEKQSLLGALLDIAAKHGMTLTICSQPDIPVPGIAPARCIDADRLSDIAAKPVAARQKGNRPGCLCAESRDIGTYDTCPMGCVYCYAVSDRPRAQARHRAHNPENPEL